jgi:hypothetical protein
MDRRRSQALLPCPALTNARCLCVAPNVRFQQPEALMGRRDRDRFARGAALSEASSALSLVPNLDYLGDVEQLGRCCRGRTKSLTAPASPEANEAAPRLVPWRPPAGPEPRTRGDGRTSVNKTMHSLEADFGARPGPGKLSENRAVDGCHWAALRCGGSQCPPRPCSPLPVTCSVALNRLAVTIRRVAQRCTRSAILAVRT